MIRKLFNKLFSSAAGAREASARAAEQQAEVETLLAQLAAAAPQRRPQLFNRLGDCYARHGERFAAMQAYGEGIDGYLENGYFDAAAALCRKVVEYEPRVIRARCTLAFLLLGKELFTDAEVQIREYVESARKGGKQSLAVARLHQLARATDSFDIRTLLGEMLLELGDAEGADRVLGSVHAERNELLAPPMEEQRERWARLLRIAITSGSAAPRSENHRSSGGGASRG